MYLPRTVAHVLTFEDRIPTVSSEEARGINPYRDTLPQDGLRPTMPQNEAGSRTDPPVSVPRALNKEIYSNQVEGKFRI